VNAFWAYFWPVFGVGLIAGILGGSIGFRSPRIGVKAGPELREIAIERWRKRRLIALSAGAVAAIIATALWHGPLGAADRFTAQVEGSARQVLADNNAPAGMAAHIHHGPLTRQLIVSGPGNDFQQAESARLLSQISGVSSASWTPSPGTPLIVEGAGAALLGFLLGLVLAYLVELRRRHNAQWNW
jgi:hypothetical protein